MNDRVAYRIFPAKYAPASLTVLAGASAFACNSWALLSIPFIWLGSLCSQPNLNLADGCLAYLAAIAGGILLLVHLPAGLAIVLGVLISYLCSAVEKHLRMRPFHEVSSSQKDS
jgi:hypothetical protein